MRAELTATGQVAGQKDGYPFGLQMPECGARAGSGAAEDFTGHELDDETALHYAGARYYMSALGRWGVTDPLAGDYPAYSPYNYVLNNPLSLIDHDGREVRCRTEDDCQRAADDINAAHANHDGDPNVTVVEAMWTERVSVGGILGFFGVTKAQTVYGYKLSVEESDFDWGGHEITQALHGIIASEEMFFEVAYVSGSDEIGPLEAPAFEIMGNYTPRGNGGLVEVSGDGNQHGVPTAIVLMHELVGHGHPVGNKSQRYGANLISQYYENKLGQYYDVHHKTHSVTTYTELGGALIDHVSIISVDSLVAIDRFASNADHQHRWMVGIRP